MIALYILARPSNLLAKTAVMGPHELDKRSTYRESAIPPNLGGMTSTFVPGGACTANVLEKGNAFWRSA
ncbi:unnamed protein product [Haemonchus placei]|uniref:Secreted protein n=1 Tax=Haemonchus placei TaxID=6290 RepID=A0A158QNS7_HAEPC|nr:unnamed protein product [Haemonchus placei]